MLACDCIGPYLHDLQEDDDVSTLFIAARPGDADSRSDRNGIPARAQPNVLRLVRMKRLQLLLKAQLLGFITLRRDRGSANARHLPIPMRVTARQCRHQTLWA